MKGELCPCWDFQIPVCVVSGTPRESGNFCREASQSIRSRNRRKRHIPNRAGDGMKTRSTGHSETQPFACDSLPVQPEEQRRWEIIHKVVGLVFQNLSNASTSHVASGKSYSFTAILGISSGSLEQKSVGHDKMLH